MNTYQIFIVENGKYIYFGKTPISGQAYAIKYSLEQKGKEVRIRYNGVWRDVD